MLPHPIPAAEKSSTEPVRELWKNYLQLMHQDQSAAHKTMMRKRHYFRIICVIQDQNTLVLSSYCSTRLYLFNTNRADGETIISTGIIPSFSNIIVKEKPPGTIWEIGT